MLKPPRLLCPSCGWERQTDKGICSDCRKTLRAGERAKNKDREVRDRWGLR